MVNIGSANAVVATAFTALAELVTVASVGGRAVDILDVVDNRDARETGRSGEALRGCDPIVGGADGGDRDSGPSTGTAEDDDGGGCVCAGGCADIEGSRSMLAEGVGVSTLVGETTVDVASSNSSEDA